MIGKELAAWLMANAQDLPVCVIDPDDSNYLPAEVVSLEIQPSARYVPNGTDGTIVAWGAMVMLVPLSAAG
jgi:hypothetical protein